MDTQTRDKSRGAIAVQIEDERGGGKIAKFTLDGKLIAEAVVRYIPEYAPDASLAFDAITYNPETGEINAEENFGWFGL